MMRPAFLLWAALAAAAGLPAAEAQITTATLLEEMADLASLARWPAPAYRTVQFSSYDRRSTHPEAPFWYANSDGFGGEPIPNFAEVLRPADASGTGLYLVADVEGPGAIARGWSAGMGGVLRVHLDGSDAPVWEGPAYEFLARRSKHFLERAGVELEAEDAFIQQDADYFPVPFAKRLRITWEGKIGELHFYHLQVRLYEKGAAAVTFDPERDLRESRELIERTVLKLVRPSAPEGGTVEAIDAEIPRGGTFVWKRDAAAGGEAITALRLEVAADDLRAALRGILLRISFDGASHPQVETPVGDLFASGPGVNPYSSLPISVFAGGAMECRFVMPFRESAALELRSLSAPDARVKGSIALAPWSWDERSLHFRAKWRVDHDMLAGGGDRACDMPYLLTRGRGVLVGLATILVNPTPVPTSSGNWWGEGDEKIFVDDETIPSTFGTGSEDYYNYSWSRPGLFDHPCCGQPLDSGPDNAGYVSNHRWQILDAIPYKRTLAVYMELWHHTPTPGLSYARIAYHYARPGALDDHRRPAPCELVVPSLPRWEPVGRGASAGSKFFHLEDLPVRVTKGSVEKVHLDIASRGRIPLWRAEKGESLTLRLPIPESGVYAIHLVALHQPGGGSFRAVLDSEPLPARGGSAEVSTSIENVQRLLNVGFQERLLEKGDREITLECTEPGAIGGDYFWCRRSRRK